LKTRDFEKHFDGHGSYCNVEALRSSNIEHKKATNLYVFRFDRIE